jgi:predicted nucleic acid-binding protein
MYLVGEDHPHKRDAQRALEGLIAAGERLVTNSEAFQEILHRYSAIKRLAAVQPAFDALRSIVDDVFPVEERHVYMAKDLLQGRKGLSSRDAVHLAVMKSNGVERILSFDTGFDNAPGVERLH